MKSLSKTKKYEINSGTKKDMEKHLQNSSLDLHNYIVAAVQLTPEKYLKEPSKTPHDDNVVSLPPNILSEKSMKNIEKISEKIEITVDEYVRRCIEFQLSDPYDRHGNLVRSKSQS